jgi:hypothetical protein
MSYISWVGLPHRQTADGEALAGRAAAMRCMCADPQIRESGALIDAEEHLPGFTVSGSAL